MSGRIFSTANISSTNDLEITDLWLEVYQERSLEATTNGIIHLVLDLLKQSCENSGLDDFELPRSIRLDTDLKRFLDNQTLNKNFNTSVQKRNDEILSRFITICIQNSTDALWMEPIQRFLRIVSRNIETVFMVVKTLICFYAEVVMLRNEPNLDFKQQLQQIPARLSTCISEIQYRDVLPSVVKTFFDRINRQPNIIQNDNDGCARIIAVFLEFANVDALRRLIRFRQNGNNSRYIFQLCAVAPVLPALCTIITDIMCIKAQELALELACYIQSVIRERRVFRDEVFKDCVLSDNQNLRNLVAQLCHVTFRRPSSNVSEPVDVLIQAVRLHQKFRKDYSKCPKRLVDTFFAEFTNWQAVFGAVTERLLDQSFINELFEIMKSVTKRVKDSDNSDELLQSFLHTAIQYLSQLDRRFVVTYDNIIYTILDMDKMLKRMNNVDGNIFAQIISQISSTDYFTLHAAQTNAILALKKLVRRGFIVNVFPQQQIDRCHDELKSQQEDLLKNINFDTNQNILQTAMKISVFASLKMIDGQAAQICTQCNAFVVSKPLDLTKNRTLLAYNLLSLVETFITEYQKTDGAKPETISGVSLTMITDRLLTISQKTFNDIDFLSQAVFLGLSRMELIFHSLSEDRDINVLTSYVLKKISLVEIDRHKRINYAQLTYIRYMLTQIHKLLIKGRPLNIPDLVAKLYKRFPDHDMAFDLMKRCVELKLFNVLHDSFSDTLKELQTKTSKKAFVKAITPIIGLIPVDNLPSIRRLIRANGVEINI